MCRPVLVGEEPVGETLRARKRVVTVVQRAEQGKACGRNLDRAERRSGAVQANRSTVRRAQRRMRQQPECEVQLSRRHGNEILG